MFHWMDQRIHAHVLICLIAYFVEAAITRRLREAKAGFTATEMFRALNEVYAVPVTVRGCRTWVRNELAGVAAEGYEVLRIRSPDRVMKVEKVDPAAVAPEAAQILMKKTAEN